MDRSSPSVMDGAVSRMLSVDGANHDGVESYFGVTGVSQAVQNARQFRFLVITRVAPVVNEVDFMEDIV